MAKTELKLTNAEIIQLVADYLGVDVVNKEEFARRVNEAIVDFIVPRLLAKQMEIDGVIKPKDK